MEAEVLQPAAEGAAAPAGLASGPNFRPQRDALHAP